MSNHNICIIVGASVVVAEDFLFFVKKWRAQDRELLLIAADAGYQLFEDPKIAQLIQPDLVVGDFDSLGSVPSHPHIIRHPAVKDDTDLMLAVREGLSQGYRQFAVFGGLGNRFDHSFANMQLLSFLQSRGARGILFGDPMHMTTIRQGELVFSEEFAGVLSVFALSEETSGVNLQGLSYELADATLSRDFPLGVSNEFLGRKSRVAAGRGELLIMWERANRELPSFSAGIGGLATDRE